MGAVLKRLAQRAGAARAKEIAMLGRRYDAATLERWNIINRVVPDEQLDTATMVLAQELAHGPSAGQPGHETVGRHRDQRREWRPRTRRWRRSSGRSSRLE